MTNPVTPEHQPPESPCFALELLGFTEAERELLSATFRLSSKREFRYLEAGSSERPDLYLANADSATAMQALHERAPNVHAPAVLIGRGASNLSWPLVQKPIQWTRLFDTLDQQMRVALLERVRRNVSAAPEWDGNGRRATDLRPRKASVAQQADALIAAAQSAESAHAAEPPQEAVLVVDDSATVRAFMRARLAPFRFHVDFAESGEMAIDMAQVRRYQCIFLDILMPGMDGYQVCKRLKNSSATRDTAVVMLSSKSSAFDKFRGSWAGCDAYLGKPVTERELLTTLARFLPSARETVEALAVRPS